MKEFQAAAVAAARAAWVDSRVYEPDEVIAKPPRPYNIVTTNAGMPGNYSKSALHGTRLVRVTVQHVGDTVGNVATAVEKSEAAFLDKTLTVTDHTTAPCRYEIVPEIRRDPDAEGAFYALSTFVFTAAPS